MWDTKDQAELERCEFNLRAAQCQLDRILEKRARADRVRAEMEQRPFGVELTWPKVYQRAVDAQAGRDLRAIERVWARLIPLDISRITTGTITASKITKGTLP